MIFRILGSFFRFDGSSGPMWYMWKYMHLVANKALLWYHVWFWTAPKCNHWLSKWLIAELWCPHPVMEGDGAAKVVKKMNANKMKFLYWTNTKLPWVAGEWEHSKGRRPPSLASVREAALQVRTWHNYEDTRHSYCTWFCTCTVQGREIIPIFHGRCIEFSTAGRK